MRGLQEHGVLTLSAGPTTLRCLPPVILTEAEADEAVGIINDVLTSGGVAGGRDGGEA